MIRKFDEIYPKNSMILAEGISYSLDDYDTKRNNNLLIVGSPGSGKTSGIVKPNIFQASGSYIISDPKGRLYEETHDYLEKQGYEVVLIDFKNPLLSGHYNPLKYIKTVQDIVYFANILAHQNNVASFSADPFWDQAAAGLYMAVLGYLVQECLPVQRTLRNMVHLISMMNVEDSAKSCELDKLFSKVEKRNPNCFSVQQYKKIRVCPTKTLQSIIVTAQASLLMLENPEIDIMTAFDDVNLSSIGDRKKAVFLVVSDTDRSMDSLANIFFSQAMSELCNHADKDCKGRLLVPVRFILDDFATNVKINDFPKYISSIRSRGISTTIILQAESQLEAEYKSDCDTIIGGCDTYVYTGGNDRKTADSVAVKSNQSVQHILSQPLGVVRIFRRGEKAITAKGFNMLEHKKDFEKRIQNIEPYELALLS